jgi:serine/threonine protein phosphatase PrpC
MTDEEEDDSTLLFDTSSTEESHLTDEHETEATFHFVVGIGLDPGLTRKHRPNEDNLSALQGIRATPKGPVLTGLFVVADGMGGHANGREASRLAVREMNNIIVPTLPNDDADGTLETDDNQEALLNILKAGVHRANLAIHERNREMPSMMGTTITAALIVNTTAYVVNVGDSRTYLYRPSEGLTQITHDHSVVARFVEHGIIKPEEIYTHPQRNQIYRCLGEHSTVEIDTFIVSLEPDDVLLLCSDGLWEMVRDPLIEKIISTSAHQPSQTSNLLIEAALQHGGADNISVIVVSIVKTTD